MPAKIRLRERSRVRLRVQPMVGLAKATQAEAEAGALDTKGMTPAQTKQAVAAQVPQLEVVTNKALAIRQVAAGGLAQGGGDLTANRTITVPEASVADAEAGTGTGVLSSRRGAAQVQKNASAADYLDPRPGAVATTIKSILDRAPWIIKYAITPKTVDGDLSGPDCTVGLQAALNSGDSLQLDRRGFYRITAPLVLKTPGQLVYGLGRDATCIVLAPGFVGNAAFVTDKTVFRGTGNPGPRLEDFWIKIFQPEVNPALSAAAQLDQLMNVNLLDMRDTLAVSIRRMKLAGGGRNMDMRGECGQAVIEDVQSCSFEVDLDIDGSLDTFRVTRLHNYFYNATVNQKELIKRTATGISVGRVDDLKVSDSMSIAAATALRFHAGAVRTVIADGYASPGGHPTATFSNHNCDVVALGIRMEDGVVNMVGGHASSQKILEQTGGYLSITGTNMAANVDRAIEKTGGDLVMSSVPNVADPGNDVTFFYQSGGTTQLGPLLYAWAGSGDITKPKIDIQGGTFLAPSITTLPRGTGASGPAANFIRIANPAGCLVIGSFPGWINSWGSGALLPGAVKLQSASTSATLQMDAATTGVRYVINTINGSPNDATSWQIDQYRLGAWTMTMRLNHEGWPEFPKLPAAADDAAAATAGVALYGLYHNAGAVRIRRT